MTQSVDKLLSSIEEYFDLKKKENLDDASLEAARLRVHSALGDYFLRALAEEKRKSSSATRKISVVKSANQSVSWDSVAKMIDALNACPLPMKDIEGGNVTKWMQIYNDWYAKRTAALNAIIPPIELDLSELDGKW